MCHGKELWPGWFSCFLRLVRFGEAAKRKEHPKSVLRFPMGCFPALPQKDEIWEYSSRSIILTFLKTWDLRLKNYCSV